MSITVVWTGWGDLVLPLIALAVAVLALVLRARS